MTACVWMVAGSGEEVSKFLEKDKLADFWRRWCHFFFFFFLFLFDIYASIRGRFERKFANARMTCNNRACFFISGTKKFVKI